MANQSRQRSLKTIASNWQHKKVTSLPLNTSPGRVTSLTAVRQNGVTAELTFNQVEGATHYVIQRQVKDESGQTSATREFVTNQTHFIDRSLNPQLAYTYTVKAMLGEVPTPSI